MAETRLETERLVFRAEREGDLAVWLEHMNTPQVMAALGGVQPRERVEAAFARMAEPAQDGLAYHFIALKSDGTLIGKCGLSRIETPGVPSELDGAVQTGWTLRADMWGRGYAREAGAAMLRHGFDVLGLPVVYGQTSESNAGSWGLMQRLGMTRRADLDYADPDYPPEDNPTMIWAMRRADWLAMNGSAAVHA